MVATQAKWILVNTTVDPLKIAKVWRMTEQECWTYIENFRLALNQCEKERMGNLPDAQDFKNELGEEGERVRRAVLVERLKKAKPESDDAKKILREVSAYMGRVKITPEMIEQAKNYPITDLIESKRHMAKCPFHNEKTPSMYLKNNFYKCFGCGESGDTIDLVMHIKGMTFPQAVQYLN